MRLNKLLYSLLSILFLSYTVIAQNEDELKSKCDCNECHQFDFWIGKWKVEWEDKDGTIVQGTNTINSTLNGCVIEENFDGNPAMDFRGKFFSL